MIKCEKFNSNLKNETFKSAKELYLKCFDDTELSADFLFENFLNNSLHIYEIKNKKIISQLFLKPCKIYKNKTGYYLYAACTDYLFRKQGLMTNIINKAKTLCKNKFIILRPANENLFKYYNNLGFNNIIFAEKHLIKINGGINGNNFINNNFLFKKVLAKEFLLLRKNILKTNNFNFLDFDETYISALDEFYIFYVFLNGFLVIDKSSVNDKKLKIPEFYGDINALKNILKDFKNDEAEIITQKNKNNAFPFALLYSGEKFDLNNFYGFLYFE